MLGHILVTDFLGEDMLIPTDFMFVNRGKVKRPPEPGDERGKIVKIDKDKEQIIDCTLVHIHEELSVAVIDTPAQIYAKLIEAYTYEPAVEESDEEDGSPDDDPARAENVPELLTGSD